MIIKPTIISFYTHEWRYKEYAQRLHASCEKFGFTSHIIETVSEGNWIRNCCKKVSFMIQCLNKYDHIIWMDADCEIILYPHLLVSVHDFGIRRWFDRGNLFSSGVVSCSKKALPLLNEWNNACILAPDRDDQILDKVFWKNKWEDKLNCLWLPPSYLRVENMFPDVKPVINHPPVNTANHEKSKEEYH